MWRPWPAWLCCCFLSSSSFFSLSRSPATACIRRWRRATVCLSGDPAARPAGDIVIFRHPRVGQGLTVKRVVGLPGERIVIKNNMLIIYDGQHPAGFTPQFDFEESLQDFPAGEPVVDRQLGSEEVFILGDNRQTDGSLDSRHATFGNLPVDSIEGVVIFQF